jgi:predicted nucleic acid-binding protein
MTVALDSMAVIWGLQSTGNRRGNPEQKDLSDLQRRARILLDILEKEKQTIVLPTVAVAEVLIGVDEKFHDQFIAEIQQRFHCPPFDLRATALAAKLWIRNRGSAPDQQIKRTVLKADVQIVATAKVSGATKFYTHEPKLRKLAEIAGLQALDLPTHHPSDMFFDQEEGGKRKKEDG